MYKVDFYTLIDFGHGPEAHLVHGYGDGTKILYYKTGGSSRCSWAAVHSDFGLAVCYGSTRAEVVRGSRDPGLLARVSAIIDSPRGDEWRGRYTRLVAAAELAACPELGRCN